MRIDNAVNADVGTDELLLAIIDFKGLLSVDEGGFSLLAAGEAFFVGCFKRETLVSDGVVAIVRFGSWETDLLLLLLLLERLPFVGGDVFGEVGEVKGVLLLRRTVDADDAELLDDELLLIKQCDGGECV